MMLSTYLFMYLLYVFFGKSSIQVFCLFLTRLFEFVCFVTELYKFMISVIYVCVQASVLFSHISGYSWLSTNILYEKII